jgi:peptidoglycan-N-acetylglucosamine deacetylase
MDHATHPGAPARDRRAAPARQPVPLSRFALVASLVALFVLTILLMPGSARINGKRVPLGVRWTVADAARFAGVKLETGDLLDGNGALLKSRGGAAATARRYRVMLALTDRVRRGDELALTPAADVTERVTTRLSYLDAPARLMDGRVLEKRSSAPFVQGLRRERWGTVSKRLLSTDVTFASAVLKKAAAVDRKKCVALTFDDGPNDVWTPQYQEVLHKYGARATFFVLCQAVRHFAPIVRRHVELGNEVGIHSWRHDDFRKLSAAQIRSDLTRCMAVMRAVGVDEVRWFRPPYGEHTRTSDSISASLGLRIALWDVDTNDWRLPGSDKIIARALKGLRGGVVILMHDGPRKRAQTLAALKVIVPAIQKRGYQLVTLSEAKGFDPNFTGEVIYTVDGKEMRLKPMRGTTVEVRGQVLELRSPVYAVGKEYLVSARPVATALGAKVAYDKPTETLRLDGPGGKAEVRLDSWHCTVNGAKMALGVPALLYGGEVLVPVAVLKRICGVGCVYDEARSILRFAAPQGAFGGPQAVAQGAS